MFRSLIRFSILSAALCCGVGQTLAQNSDAHAPDSPAYQLSPAAAAAGIDGKLTVGLTINADGSASDVTIYGGPMSPCGSPVPNSLIEEVRKDVRRQILATKFTPAIKNGKPKSTAVEITFMLSGRFKGAAANPGLVFQGTGDEPGLVDLGPLNERVVTKPSVNYGTRRGVAELQVLVDGNGKVISAGGYKGDPTMIKDLRDFACKTTLKPGALNGKPVHLTGTLAYYIN